MMLTPCPYDPITCRHFGKQRKRFRKKLQSPDGYNSCVTRYHTYGLLPLGYHTYGLPPLGYHTYGLLPLSYHTYGLLSLSFMK